VRRSSPSMKIADICPIRKFGPASGPLGVALIDVVAGRVKLEAIRPLISKDVKWSQSTD
jgi:hypothetical protein